MWFPGSLGTHLIAPLAAVLDFIFYARPQPKRRGVAFCSLVPPLSYAAISLLLSRTGIRYEGDSIVPYYFLNDEELGWLRIYGDGIGVIYWISILSLVALVIGKLLLILNSLARRRS